MDYLLSYPRTGNSFVRYAIEYVTRQRTYDYGKSINDQYDTDIQYEVQLPNLPINDVPFIVRKEHFVLDIPEKPEKIVLIVRDFKNVFISHHFRDKKLDKDEIIKEFNSSIETFWKDYYELLYLFETFPDNKLFVYYEDLISDTKVILKRIFDLYQIENYNDFLDNIDYHKDYFLEKYKTKEGSKSEGFSNLYNIFSEEEILSMNEFFRRGNPELFDKYLRRYI